MLLLEIVIENTSITNDQLQNGCLLLDKPNNQHNQYPLA